VTKTDTAVEALLKSSLAASHPHILFLGEETHGASRLTSAPTFVVDPVDGTTNFVHGDPHVAVSLGLSVGRAPVVGVVYNPFHGELFSAVRGRGAFLRCPSRGGGGGGAPVRLPVRDPATEMGALDLAHALVAVEWGANRAGNDLAVRARSFERLVRDRALGGGGMVHSMRSLGSAALNMCAVAAGRFDAYWEAGCWAWDVCAGWCILSEAGGAVVDANPGVWKAEMDGRRYLAVRGDGDAAKGEFGLSAGQKRFVEEFWACVEGKFEVNAESTE
jgi:myo-inositol-1(or 4)-monophosphatase